ncbi:hypothetical protein FHS43_000457 [Streptosporangium becharense]|uniref:DUF1963 domain-containing protein n=1 Tax=Streptosporangium becharense TaxID=1816182 RepID=A0A7W9IFW9_9ACTN|nr:DUF1963 domain-containing protein [Streptosporangium becharense]MBB2909211.1 hypothetical protein [Streptosporangium becharense]MBB5819770.1 hypothetical protein [Streptosporangium becharense]
MGLTTPPAPFDMAAVFPELADWRRTTVRLHPRRGTPSATDSSLGGPLLWPADEPWPVCPVPQTHDLSGGWGPLPLVPILQLLARDVPELPFPDDTDTLQMLWCPVDHQPFCEPHPVVRWRRATTAVDRPAAAPEPAPDSEKSYLPEPCVLSPERVEEYPMTWVLPRELRVRIREWEEGVPGSDGWGYLPHLSTAPGSKVGGWVRWIREPEELTCGRGHGMTHLLTIAGRELDGESGKRWAPVEERRSFERRIAPEIQNPAGLMPGGVGSLHLFTCLECPERPVDYLSQWT